MFPNRTTIPIWSRCSSRKIPEKDITVIQLISNSLPAIWSLSKASPGHDIGEVTLTGRLVLIQMKKNDVKIDNPELKRVYRKAKPNDFEKFEEAKAKEHDTMIRARKIAEDLHLNMKIGDVEYQGDGNKAIFYYIADERVDFRQLIKVLAEAFRVRIEMKRIGARQEAGRIGGLGPCGRQLVLFGFDDQLCLGSDQCCPFPRYSPQSSKVGRTMCQIEMLLEL